MKRDNEGRVDRRKKQSDRRVAETEIVEQDRRLDSAGDDQPTGEAADSVESSEQGRYSYPALDRAIHERARLSLMTSLVSNPNGLLFAELKEMCELTDGNLSRHLHHLQQAGYVEVWKRFYRNRPQTLCRATREGTSRFLAYVAELEKLVRDAALTATDSKNRDMAAEGWSPA